MTLDRLKNHLHSGKEDEKKQAKRANALLYAILASNTAGRAKQLAKEVTVAQNCVDAWVRLWERFRKTTGARMYDEIFNLSWTSTRPFDDKLREWGAKMSRLPSGSLSVAAKEAVAIGGTSMAHQTALEQLLRLKSPQAWSE